ncbi:MAG: sensor domain-containing diguanylate cyclase [Armatimonadetes bacterium]|nr:sensor domain-containing diguanylate cyclase [Armatimonadota bacterium]
MALIGVSKNVDERRSAKILGYLSALTTALLIFCIFGGGALTAWYTTHTDKDNRVIQAIGTQQGIADQLTKLAISLTESRRGPALRGIAITPTGRQKLEQEFSEQFSKWQDVESGLMRLESKSGVPAPSRTVFAQIEKIDGKFYRQMADTLAEIKNSSKATGNEPLIRASLGKLVWSSQGYRKGLDSVASSIRREIVTRTTLFRVWSGILGVAAFASLIFIFFVTTKGNLARLDKVIHQLRDTQIELEHSLSESQTALLLSNMASRRFEQLFSGLPIGCFTCDHAGIIYEWNTACEQLTGFHAYEVYMKSIFETIYSNAERATIQPLLEQVLAGQEINGVQLEERRKDGSSYTALVNLLPMKGVNGQITSVILANADITALKMRETELKESQDELRQANSKLTALATTDGLTGLLNHRAFQERLEQDFKQASLDSTPLSLALLDVDKFKVFNDSFGHPAGDVVLKQVAKLMRQAVPDSFCAARYGGEEFVIVMPGANAELGTKFAEAVRAAIEGSEWANRQVTASFGVATVNASHSQPSDLIRDADQALYASKDAGRNFVSHFDHIQRRAA